MPVNVLKLLADWIEDNTGFVSGTTLQVNFREQAAPDRCIVLLNRSGSILYNTARTRFDFMLQVVSRSGDWGEAHDDISEIHDLFYTNKSSHINLPAVTPEIRIENIVPISGPASIGQDENKRHEFSVNYRLNSWYIV